MVRTLPHYLPLPSFLHSCSISNSIKTFFLNSFLFLSVSRHLWTNFVGIFYVSLFDSQVLCELTFRKIFFKSLRVTKMCHRSDGCLCGHERIKDEWEVER